MTLTLFLIIFLEGYVVLSTELLAIRLLIPFTGSGTDTISIIIAAVLMPLAFGYEAGGRFKTRKNGTHKSTVRKKLIFNLIIAGAILSFGLSYVFLSRAIETLYLYWGWTDRTTLTAIYSIVFLVYPVFLLGQTVPLISNYFSKARLPVMAGKILFFSTLGSFVGAVLCTLILMTYVGVHYTAVITIGCIALLVIILSKKLICRETIAALTCLALALALNNGATIKYNNIVANNKYHTIQVENYGHRKSIKINNNMSAGIDTNTGKSYFDYIRYMEQTFIDPIIWGSAIPRDILVIGAGGFTLGLTDKKNNYTFVDIDKDLKNIAEKEFLEQKLSHNKHFEAVPARAFLYGTDKKFDLILLDIFHGPSLSPEHLVTREFFQQVKDALKTGGAMAGNYVLSPTFSDDFSINIDNTIRSVFPNTNRHIIDTYNSWDPHNILGNIIYSYHHNPDASNAVYTDNKNSSLFDKPR